MDLCEEEYLIDWFDCECLDYNDNAVYDDEIWEFNEAKVMSLSFYLWKWGYYPFAIADEIQKDYLKSAVSVKNAILRILPFSEISDKALASCIMVSAISGNIDECRKLILKYSERFCKKANNNRMLASNLKDYGFFEYVINKCIDKLKAEKETLEIVQLIRNYAEFIDNAELAAEYARKEEEILGEIEGFKFE